MSLSPFLFLQQSKSHRLSALAIFHLLLLTCSLAFSSIVTKAAPLLGNPRYLVEAGHFDNPNSALQLKLKLLTTIKQPINIVEDKTTKSFSVQIGPIDNLKIAQNIDAIVSPNQTPASTASTPSTPTAPALTPTNIAANESLSNTEPNSLNQGIPYPKLRPTSSSEKKLWNLHNADIRAVINEVSRVTGKNFIVDPRVQGKISITSSTPISNKELYQVFLSMLQTSGFSAVPSGTITKIVPNIDARASIDQPNHRAEGEELLVEVVPIHNVPAEQLVPVLRPLMPQWSNVAANPASNQLVLSGRASSIHHMVSIIKQVDSSDANGIDMVPLRHALAGDVANTLKDLVKPTAGSNGMHQATIAADDRSNSILLSGNKTDRIKIRLLISQLDSKSEYGNNSNTQVIYLHFRRAEDLVPILAGVAQANFSGTVGTTIGTITQPTVDSTDPSSNFANNSGAHASSNPFASAPNGQGLTSVASPNTAASSSQSEGTTKPTVQLIAEPNTNSIIINAPASIIRILRTVISQLDIQPAQLLIEALVTEIDESDVKSLGIEWGTNTNGDPNTFRPGFAIINSKTSLRNFQAQLYALVRDRKANILSTPSVVVLDNRQAKILVGRQLSVATTSYPNNAGGSTTASPYQTFDRVNVALHLYVRPQITQGTGIQMQIDQGNDTLDPSSVLSTADNPIFKISSIVTSVHVESGDIVVLGGLIQDSLANDDNRLPILGDIPGIGRIFQHNIRNREKRVLMVFIKPQILPDERTGVQLSGTKYHDLREHQLSWLRSQDFYQDNKEAILPPMKTATLPRPFSSPPGNRQTEK